MLNFNNGEERLNKFSGSEKKTTILYEGTLYMLKYPGPIRSHKLRGMLSYKNNQFSEHIGSNIFRASGFKVQETVLGYFTDKSGKEKIVVGCKDFTQDGSTLYEVSKLANQAAVSSGKLDATIENVVVIIGEIDMIKDKDAVLNSFWDMFVIDALIGNSDRHFGNWGVLEKDGDVSFSPIYDCGSSLGALLDDEEMKKLMAADNLFKNKEFNVASCYSMDGKRIFYHGIFKNPPIALSEAIKRVTPRIDMAQIQSIVDSTPIISETRKEYLKKALNMRYEQILLPASKIVLREEQAKSPAQNMDTKDTPKTKSTLMERLEEGKQKAREQRPLESNKQKLRRNHEI